MKHVSYYQTDVTSVPEEGQKQRKVPPSEMKGIKEKQETKIIQHERVTAIVNRLNLPVQSMRK